MKRRDHPKREAMPRLLSLFVVLLTLWHCTKPASGPPPSELPAGVRLDLDETQIAKLEELSHALAADIAGGQGRLLDRVFDYDHLLRRVLHGLEIPSDFSAGFISGLRGNPGGVAAGFLGQNCEFLRVLDRDGVPTLLFRLKSQGGGFNYHAFLFRLDEDDSVKLYDFYNFGSGEHASESMRRLAIPALAMEESSILGKLLGRDRAFFEHMDTLQEIGRQNLAQNHPEVLRLIETLPQELREDKSTRLMEITALALLGGVEEQRHFEAIESYRDAFPDDASIPLVMFDYYALRGDYDVAMGLVDRLEELVGGDPYLETLRISAALLCERHTEAMERAREYLAANPDDEKAHWLQVSAALGAQEFGVVRQELEALEEGFYYQFSEELLAADPAYAEFLRSDHGRNFLARS